MTCAAPSGRRPLYLNLPCPKGLPHRLKFRVFARPLLLSKAEPRDRADPRPMQAKAAPQASPAAVSVEP